MEYLFINSLYNQNSNQVNQINKHMIINSEIKQLNEMYQNNFNLEKKENNIKTTNSLSEKINKLENPIINSTQERARFYHLNKDKKNLKYLKY
jgi:hypothetical protein